MVFHLFDGHGLLVLLFHGGVRSGMCNHAVGYWCLRLRPESANKKKGRGFSSSRLSDSQGRRGKTDHHNTPDNVEV